MVETVEEFISDNFEDVDEFEEEEIEYEEKDD
jgi:hypothetical protein